ncbi:hypothetical protein HanIR_Chr17g0895931 [Helianthus annuus]|nr:hypothetical protein HanIR_Chr17g0895931 [Helianthus annuus]
MVMGYERNDGVHGGVSYTWVVTQGEAGGDWRVNSGGVCGCDVIDGGGCDRAMHGAGWESTMPDYGVFSCLIIIN